MMYIKLPNVVLSDSFLSCTFKGKGVSDFHTACDFIWKLPYGRTASSSVEAVIVEEKGTCSSKHRVLKMLADELGVLGVELVVGVYLMNERNTSGVGKILDSSEFESIPEAHCYLKYHGNRLDFTRFGVESKEKIDILVEKVISPADLEAFKKPFHYKYILENYGEEKAGKLWQCRERCIAALGT